jgi:GNAT superfamily N-acetyltransferase
MARRNVDRRRARAVPFPMEMIEITDARGTIVRTRWLERAEAVHRALRTALPVDYRTKMQRVFAGGGRMVLATEGDAVAGLAVWRVLENTAIGVHLYVDDLVTDEARRSLGVGHALMQWLEQRARELSCVALVLDSGTQRTRAHRFYFREGMAVVCFNFSKDLSP